MPVMYIDKAVCTEPAGCGKGVRYGDPVDSNRWMFTMPGGGGCHAEFCGAIYAESSERPEMTTAGKPPQKSMNGIHDPDPRRIPCLPATTGCASKNVGTTGIRDARLAKLRARLEVQSQTLLRHASTRSEMARGIDRSYGTAGCFPMFYAWMTDCQSHEGAYLDDTFFRSTISTSATSYTMRQWLEEFMKAPRAGMPAWQIDGGRDASGREMNMTRCR